MKACSRRGGGDDEREQIVPGGGGAGGRVRRRRTRACPRRNASKRRRRVSSAPRDAIASGWFDVWAMRPMQRLMRNSERRKCFEVLTKLREVPDPDDDPDDEEEPPRLLIEPFETLPTPRELPDYYELVRCPVDQKRRAHAAPFCGSVHASPWFFARGGASMSPTRDRTTTRTRRFTRKPGMLRRAFHQEMVRQLQASPCPGRSASTRAATSPCGCDPAAGRPNKRRRR